MIDMPYLSRFGSGQFCRALSAVGLPIGFRTVKSFSEWGEVQYLWNTVRVVQFGACGQRWGVKRGTGTNEEKGKRGK